jgi:hypothetical protein
VEVPAFSPGRDDQYRQGIKTYFLNEAFQGTRVSQKIEMTDQGGQYAR